MKIYIISISDVYDYVGYHHSPFVYLKKKEAIKKLAELKKSARKCYPDFKLENGKESFSLYEDGRWGTSHYDAIIDTVEIPGKISQFKLNVIFGEQASRKACDIGYKNAAKDIHKGALDGSCVTYAFDTEHDRDLATEILNDSDGWLVTYWEKQTRK